MDTVGHEHSLDMLARLLRRDAAVLPDGVEVERLPRMIELAGREGVTGLLYARLSESPWSGIVPVQMQPALDAAMKAVVTRSLCLESHCRRILALLKDARISSLLLKGTALAYWAYPAPWQRSCSDIDLLLRSHEDAQRAALLLAKNGYGDARGALPGDMVCFERTLESASDGVARVEVDLHWRLSSSPLFAFRLAWPELDEAAVELPSLGAGARGLAPTHAWLHACMHRMQNRANGVGDMLKWLYDLDLLGRMFSPDAWDELVTLAGDRGLAGVALDGADAAAARFGVVMPEHCRGQLARMAASELLDTNRMHRWWYVQRMNFLAIPGIGQKARWLRQRIMPDRAHLQARYGADLGLGRAMLMRIASALKR